MRQNPETARRPIAAAAGTAPLRDLTAARHRALLRMRVEICAALGKRVAPPLGAAVAMALRLGDEAAAELAGIPDTPELRRRDAALLEGADAAGAGFATRLRKLVEAYRNGRALDLFTASPTELLACCIARVGPDWTWVSESSWPG